MRIVVSGAGGLIGRAITAKLIAAGHQVIRLARAAAPAAIAWDFVSSAATSEVLRQLEGCDALLHLAGENISGVRWTAAKKARIRDSRVLGTRHVAEALARLQRPPATLLTAAAIGIYGSRGEETLTESSAPGSGFLAGVGAAWEQAAEPARQAGIRVVHLRFGVVLSAEGGALKAMLPAFRFGVGGRIGPGRQWLSWITLEDATAAILFALAHERVSGAVNVVGPNPATNADFTRTLARVLRRPATLPLPALAIRLLMGEMGESLLLSSARVLPARLQAEGFKFEHRELEPALRHLLRRK